MAEAYVEEFLYRGRCPDTETGVQSDFHVVLAKFVDGLDGTPQIMRTAALTPSQAAEQGFTLDKIVGEVSAAALRDRDAANTAAAAALAERDQMLATIQAAAAASDTPVEERSLLNKLSLGLFK